MVTEERARAKRWGAPAFVLVWIGPGDKARLTVEHVDPIAARYLVGWRAGAPGLWHKVVAWGELPAELERVGRALSHNRKGA